jgi:hypothetical protein
MWRDIGLGDWLFDLDIESEAANVADNVIAMARDFTAAKAKPEVARAVVLKRQKETMDLLKQQFISR